MIQMIVILIVLVAAVWLLTKLKKRKGVEEEEIGVLPDADCCGAHEVCEVDSLLNSSNKIVYFDDEHLDVYKAKSPDEYNDDEIEEFREVLYTLNDNEVASWLKSLMLRVVELPVSIREEALMIVEERRELSN